MPHPAPESALAIAVFARAPLPGRTKSRLVPALGVEGAARLHARLLRLALSAAQDVESAALYLYAADDEAAAHFAGGSLPAAGRWSVEVQRGDDLGERMADAFARLLARYPAALLIGSDIVDVQAADLKAAGAALASEDAVIATSADGGYWLLGLRTACPALFTGVAWGSDRVFAETCVRLAGAGLRWRELPMRHDIDTPADLERCREAIRVLG